MLPKTHIILGAIFTLVVLIIFPKTPVYGIILIFLSSFLIDFDHYLSAVTKTRSLSIKKAFNYHIRQGAIALREKAKGIRRKGTFHLFHTLEFLVLIYLLGLLWKLFLYILIGMIFHSILDVIYLIDLDLLYRRDFSLIAWLARISKK